MKKIKSQVRSTPKWKSASKPPWRASPVTGSDPARRGQPRTRPDRVRSPEEQAANEATLRAARVSTSAPGAHPYWPGRQP